MENFLILSNFRCGTHYLHALIAANGYTMQDEFTGKIQRLLSPEVRKEVRAAARNGRKAGLNFEQIQEKLVELGVRQHRQAKVQEVWKPRSVGILHRIQSRLLYGKLSPEAELAKLKELFPNTTFILLTRDPVEAAVSWFFARHERSFFSHQAKRRQEPPIYNEKEIQKWVSKYEGDWLWSQELADHVVDYSELLINPEDVMARLGLSLFEQNQVEKQIDPLKDEYIQRFKTEKKNKGGKA